MPSQEIHIAFRVLGTKRAIHDLVNRIPVKPMGIWYAGQIRPRTSIREINNGIEFHRKSLKATTLNHEVKNLLKTLRPALPMIEALPPRFRRQLACAIYSPHAPELFLDEDALSALASCKASIDIDLYSVAE